MYVGVDVKRCRLWLSKEEVDRDRLRGKMVIIIDALLATTTLITMMERGAKRVYPVDSIEEAERVRTSLAPSIQAIRGGEQGGIPVNGFELGHLPTEYPEDVVADAHIIFLSTNGTKAIRRTDAASKRLLCSFRNVHKVAEYVQAVDPEEVVIVCSGASGHFSMEDYLCAARFLELLDLERVKLDDASILATHTLYTDQEIAALVSKSRIGRSMVRENLQELLDFVLGFRTQSLLVDVNNEGILSVLEEGGIVHECAE
ncbi:2-phosphosulfolactate phosphatase [Geomicrobium sp. JCM 19039]|uniref:2-phosphosulfolactate phosphatase n=1 Tax=Geomicrobium sp. JCM 19039 TaxID=1460636 RepID=UPI00045F1419|nr:2-phosphosulfolactate phosphatase [Geomicrobium sp. JCM 19039]GAK11511.1 probable 2-phosphosulfolactate phosphatase [Geomicrobium sp. JCM 19039]